MTFYIKHRLSRAALKDLLTLFQHFLPENNLPKTEFQLLQVVNELIPPCDIQKFFYCKECLCYYVLNPKLKVCSSCLSEKGTNFFIELDVIDQIKFLFEKRNLAEKLHVTPFKENTIQDITDGSEYRRVNARNNRQQFDLTLILNTDGISLSKSSKSHCWPLMFKIAEIPEHLRDSFIIILGIWYDTLHKPSMNTFLKPFCDKLEECFKKGVSWINPVTKKTCNSKIIAPLFIADAPARAQLLNMINFNGKFGCNICEIESTSIKSAKGKRKKLIYQFQNELSLLRSGIRMKKQAEEALKKNALT
ncbi:uncharacterized protein LOC130663030 isoform X2 [Microplitis mediator]|uniref:uncharacterized protein LOC130663030 isoform X2 n=1 Tax=Microplitis mediator TaxID=375433 RepID=UPI00255551D4|nr:uncharacterized protein LOC130663030 isoform X2 [Microplitis mediator]